MSFQVVTELSEIARLKDRWNELSADRPFASWNWYHSWYQHMGSKPGTTPFVLVERAGQRVTTIVPFYLTRSKFAAHRLCLAANGSTCTDYGQIIAAPGRQSYSIAKLASWLTAFNRPQPCIDFVEFDGLAADDASTGDLVAQFTKCGFLPSRELLDHCWAVDLPPSWSELDATFSRKHRRKTKKAVARIAECQTLNSQSSDFEWLWNSFVVLHQKRRRAVGDAGCFAQSNFEKFLKTATQGLVDRGLAEILVVASEQHPIAASVIFNDRNTAYMYQSGFDPRLAGHEPGYMMIVGAMQWSIAKGLHRFDFMRGNEAYKARWNTTAVPMVRLQFQLSDNFRTRLESTCHGTRKLIRSSLSHLGLNESAAVPK